MHNENNYDTIKNTMHAVLKTVQYLGTNAMSYLKQFKILMVRLM